MNFEAIKLKQQTVQRRMHELWITQVYRVREEYKRLKLLQDSADLQFEICPCQGTILLITTQTPIDELLDNFFKRGGTVNQFYLKSSHKNKPTVVNLNGWYSGKSLRDALIKALSANTPSIVAP